MVYQNSEGKETRWDRIRNFITWLPEAPKVILAAVVGLIYLATKRERK